MVGELMTLPLRAGIRASQLYLRVATETVAVAADATGRLIDGVVSRPGAEPVFRPREPIEPDPVHVSEARAE